MKRTLLTALVALLAITASAQAGILLNLTDTVHFTDGDAEASESPGIQVGSVAGDNWNQINSGSVGSIVDDAGASTGVTVDVGATTGTTLDYDTNPNFNDLGLAFDGGIYAGNAQSAIFTGGQDSDSKSGIRVAGLDAGLYTIYVTAKNTNNDGEANGTDAYDIFYGTVASDSGDTDFSGFDSASMTNASTDWDDEGDVQAPDPTSWIAGDNYVAFDVDVAAGQDLVIVSDGTNTDEDRGFLNTVEIVPEPATMSLLAIGGLGAL
ncbi:MAG: PEP-CTERM sorting domain-containing protein, partial [Planctomycetota bacterium]